jgi:hypothetical protein
VLLRHKNQVIVGFDPAIPLPAKKMDPKKMDPRVKLADDGGCPGQAA